MPTARSNDPMIDYVVLRTAAVKRIGIRVLLAVALFGFGLPRLCGQTVSATLTGAITDSTGAVLPGATVTIVDKGTGVKRQSVANKDGLYTVPQLPPATYTVSASHSGFKTALREGVVLQINQTADVSFSLKIGSAQDTVEVSTEGPLLETETVSLGAVIDEKQVNDLPLNGRQFSQLIQLAPGVTPLSVGQTLSPSIGSGVISPGVDGQSNRSNLVFIDGVLTTDNLFSSYSVSPSIDAIQSFQVQTHASDAQFGQSTGGTINVLTKSGTSHVHGTAYEFFRNQDLEADFYNVPDRAPFKINDFGGTIGGPVLKNKLFLFGYYEGVRQTIPVPEYSTIATAQELTGNFNDTNIPIYDPATFNAATLQSQQFNYNGQLNTIDPSRINPGMIAVLKAFLPAGGPNFSAPASSPYGIYNYKYIGSNNFTQNQYGIRGDYNITSRDLFYTRVLVSSATANAPGQLPGNGYVNYYNDKNVSMNYVHIFSPTLTMQVTGGLNYFDYPQYAIQNNAQSVFDAAGYSAGFTSTPGNIGLPYIPGILVYGGAAGGGFNISAGWGGKGQNQQTLEQVSANVSKQAGAHTLRFGAAMYWTNEAGNYASDIEYFFPQTTGNIFVPSSGNSLASLLIGLPIIANRQLGDSLQVINDRIFGIFAEDTWKVSPKLNINYGLRWDYNTPPTEAKNRYSYFDFRTNTWLLSPGNPATPAVLPVGVAIAPKNTINSPQYTEFSPRLGISYSYRPGTVLHIGAGSFYDNWAGILQAAQSSRGSWPNGAVQNTGIINYYQVTPNATAQNPFGNTQPIIPNSPFPAASTFWDTKFKIANSWQYNVEIQQVLAKNSYLSIAYAGSSTAHAPITIPINAPINAFSSTVPFPQMGAFSETEGAGHMKYSALQSKYVQRLDNGLTAIGSFTWSKTIDVGCSDIFVSCQIQSPNNLKADEGRSVIDVPLVFSVAAVYDLPFGRGKSHLASGLASYILGNFEISSILLKRSGSTVNPTFSSNASGGITSRPNVVGDPRAGAGTRSQYFNPAAFALPTQATPPTGPYAYGNAGRNSLRGPGFVNMDFTLARNFVLPKKEMIQFRADTFNIFNHPNFYNPDGNISNADFGKLIGVGGNPREFQLALKYVF